MSYAIHQRHFGRHVRSSRNFSNREDAERSALAEAPPNSDDTSVWFHPNDRPPLMVSQVVADQLVSWEAREHSTYRKGD
jgi:hypothetical protein